MKLGLTIRAGTIVDSTGWPRLRADLGLRDGRTAAVAEGEPLQGRHPVDPLAPGQSLASGVEIDVATRVGRIIRTRGKRWPSQA